MPAGACGPARRPWPPVSVGALRRNGGLGTANIERGLVEIAAAARARAVPAVRVPSWAVWDDCDLY